MSKKLVPFLAALLAVCAAFVLTGCDELAGSMSQGLAPSESLSKTERPQPSQNQTRGAAATETVKPAPLVAVDEVVGKGHAAKPADKVTVHYTGWLADGSEFDSSLDGKPLTFTIGAGKVIPGLSRGVIGMAVGGKRKLTVQPEIAYGGDGDSDRDIPPNAVVVFEVELLKIHK